MASSPRRIFFSSVAALGAAESLPRPGASLPGATAPYAAAPPADQPGFRSGARHRMRRSLVSSTAEGMVAEVVTACAGGAVLTGWALFLSSSPLVIGLLGALPYLAQFVQLPAVRLSMSFGYRRVAILAVSASRQVLLPLVALPFLPLSDDAKRAVLLAVAGLSAVLGVIGNNAWVAWMGDLVPPRIRGRYFGRRNALCALGATASSLGAGLLLDRAGHGAGSGLALSGLALTACAAGAVTTVLMRRQHDPRAGQAPEEELVLREGLSLVADPCTRSVLAFQLTWGAAVGTSAAFYSLHMLQNLRMGYTQVALYNAGLASVRILAAPLWGRALDRVGARTILSVCSFGISVIPMWWLLPREGMLWPLAADVLLSGILWSGHGLAAFALPLSLAPRRGKPLYLAACSTAGGLSFAAAAALAGLLAQRLPVRFTYLDLELCGLHVLFALSALGRLGAAFLSLRIAEPGARPALELFRLASRGVASLLLPRT